MASDPLHLLREVTRTFARLQREARACCTPRAETQCRILTELASGEAVTVGEIAERIASDAPWVSRTVEQLRQAGWVERSLDPADRRIVRICLTEEGASRARALHQVLDDQAEAVLQHIPPERQGQVLESLQWLASALRAVADTPEVEGGSPS